MPPTKRQMKKRAANDRKEPNHVRAASHQAATVAAVIAGVDESQKMRNKEVAKDEVIAKAFFGSTEKMGDVTSFDAAGLAANVEDVGKAASEVCGDGDGCSLVDETKSVDRTLIDMKTLFSEMDAGVMLLLKDEKAFENMTGLQVKMRKVEEKRMDLEPLIEALKSAKDKEPEEAARELFQSVKLMESVKFMSSEIVHSEPLWVVFDKDNLESYLKKIDDLIKFEPIHEKIYKFNKQITEMPHQLVPIIKQANFLSKKISEAIHDGFETQLVQMNSVASSFRSNSVSLRRMLTDFDTIVREFEEMYLEGAGGHGNNGIQIRTILEPIDSLIGEMKTLLPSLESVNVGDDIWEKVQNVGTNTKKAKSEIETLSTYSKVHECAAKFTATESFSFENLSFFKKRIEEVQAKQPRDQYNSLLKVASNMPKFDNFYGFFKSNTESNIETEFLKAPPKLIEETLEELEKLDTVFDSFWRTMEDWINDKTLDKAIAKISMKPLVETFECLAKENLLDIPDSGRMIAIPNLKSNNPDMRAVAQLADSLVVPIDLLILMQSTPDKQQAAPESKQLKRLENAADIAAKWHEASRHLQSWADAFDVVSHVVDQAKWEASIDQTSPDPTRPKTIVCWDSDFKKMMKELPKGLHQLNLNVPAPHLNITQYCTLIEKFRVAPQLFRQSADCEIEDLLKELSTVTDTRTRHLLQQLVKLRLSHEEAEKILSEAGATFVPMEQFLKENLDTHQHQVYWEANPPSPNQCPPPPVDLATPLLSSVICFFVGVGVGYVSWVKLYKFMFGNHPPPQAPEAPKEAQKKQEKNKDAEEKVIKKKTAENQKKQNEMTSSLKQKMYDNRGKSKRSRSRIEKASERGERQFAGTDVASNKKDDALVVPKKPEGADPPMDLKIRRIYVRNEFLTDNETALNIFVLLSTFLTREFREVEGWRELRYRKDKPRHPLHAKEVILVCDAAKALFAGQEPLLELTDYHRIYGDVHGCYESLYQLVVGTDGKLLPVPIIILGDIVDRGQRSIDCVLLVCALKLAYPHLVHWIRGNHELVHINSKYGLLAECYGAFGGKEGAEVFTAINGLMRSLPMAAILCDKIFVCHGGIYKGFTSRERMKELIKRKEEATTKEEIEAATCLLWADPGLYFKGNNANEPAFLPSARGAQGAETFNMAAAEEFRRDCRFDVIIRGHQIPTATAT